MENKDEALTFFDYISWIFYKMLFKINKLELFTVIMLYIFTILPMFDSNFIVSLAMFNFTFLFLINLNSQLIIRSKDIIIKEFNILLKDMLDLNEELLKELKQIEATKPSQN